MSFDPNRGEARAVRRRERRQATILAGHVDLRTASRGRLDAGDRQHARPLRLRARGQRPDGTRVVAVRRHLHALGDSFARAIRGRARDRVDLARGSGSVPPGARAAAHGRTTVDAHSPRRCSAAAAVGASAAATLAPDTTCSDELVSHSRHAARHTARRTTRCRDRVVLFSAAASVAPAAGRDLSGSRELAADLVQSRRPTMRRRAVLVDDRRARGRTT